MDVTSEFIGEFLKNKFVESKIYKKNSFLFREGEIEDGVFFIEEGKVRIIKTKWVLWRANAKEIIGVSSFFSPELTYRFSAKADEDCKIYKISHAQFHRLLTENTMLSNAIINMMCSRIAFTNNRLKSIMTKSSRFRLITEIVDRSLQSDAKRIPYSLEELAEIVGISKRMIRSNLKELEDGGYICRSKEFIDISDRKGLEIIARKAL